MPGPIFLHFQTYSRKPNPAGNFISQIIAEALRRPEYSGHVQNPKPPRVVLGAPDTFEADHAAHVEARGTEVKRKGKTYRKGIRQDRHTLATVVASYPLTHEQIKAGGPDAVRHHQEWEARSVEWMRAKYGEQVRVVLAHDDEAHPHLHFWMLPDDQDARADTLHPGKLAKRAAEAEARAAGLDDREAVRVGNIALKAAMRDTLEDYWQEVGQPLGMTRDGPKRQRLTRAEWKARKQEAARIADALKKEGEAVQVVKEAEARDAETKNRRAKFKDDAREWVEKNRKMLDDRTKELDRISEAFEVEKAKAIETIQNDRAEVKSIKKRLDGLLDQAEAFLKRPDLPALARKAGAALMKAAGRPVPEPAKGQSGIEGLRKKLGIPHPSPTSPPPEKPRPEPGTFDGPGF